MTALEDKRYSISEVSEHLELPVHLLRQWEKAFSQLKPKRNQANRRYYTLDDIRLIKRIKQLVRTEKMTHEGAYRRLKQELLGEGVPQTNEETLDIIDTIEAHARHALNILDNYQDN
jgi:DNA-binding transcriptional MerR regulator